MQRLVMMVMMVVVMMTMSVVFNAEPTLAHEVKSPSELGTSSAQLDVRRSLNGLTRQLLDLKASHEQTTDGAAKQNVLGSLVALAAQRQDRLAAMIENYPGEVIAATVSAQVRASLPPGAQGYIEEEVTLEGDLEVWHADGPDGGRYIHFLRVAGSRLSMHFAGTPAPFQTDDRVRVRGVRVLKALAAQANGSITALAAAAVPNTFGPQRTAVFLLSFQDKPAVTSISPADARNVVFDSPSSVSNFFYEASYEQTWLTGDIFGPYVIPYPTGSCDVTAIQNYAQLLAMAAGVETASYPRHVYAVPSTGCPWWGLGSVGGAFTQTIINGSFVNGVVSHEMGHNLGLYHSHALECGSAAFGNAVTCASVEYGDTLDTMGSATPPKHFNAAQKERLGWLNHGVSPPITTVAASGVYTIDPYETVGSNPKALKVKTGSGDWYYVEYRQPIGFDASIVAGNTNVINGVVIHWSKANRADGVYLLDMTPETSSWWDPALGVSQSFRDGGGVTITPVWVGANAGVSVTLGGGGPTCVRQNPTVKASPAAQQGAPGVGVTYSISITNNDSSCTASSFNQQATVPTGWTASFASPSLTLVGAATATTTLTVKPPTTVSAGTYTINPASTNVTVGGYASSTTATYAIGGGGSAGTFTDAFARADSTVIGNGWKETAGNLELVNGELRNAPTRSLHTATVPGLTGSTQQAAASFASTDNNLGPRFGVMLRHADPTNYYACYRQGGESSFLGISRIQNGVETVLKSVKMPNPKKGAWFKLACRAEGSTLTLELGSVTLAVSDTAFSNGTVGLLMGYPRSTERKGHSHRADDFSATVR